MPVKTEDSTDVSEERVQEIVMGIQSCFLTFGGTRKADGFNPITAWTEGQPAQFAAGVDVADVVRFVLERSRA
jgi:hypothetical protein